MRYLMILGAIAATTSLGCSPDPCPSATQCGQSCVDTDNDAQNCGGCGLSCAEGELCIEGSCGVACLGGSINCDGV